LPARLYTLTPNELELLRRGKEDPNLLTGYWFRRPGQELGFQFDYNFDPDGAWQVKAHTAVQSIVVVVGGVGTGKTLGVGMSAVVWAMLTEEFKFLNVAQKAWQAHLMWEKILECAQGTPFMRLIEKAIERPYPKIVIAFKIGERVHRSTMEFMSVADDAMGIFSWRGDMINIEEAGHIENLAEVTQNLITRLTGSTTTGRPYVGRMSLISNPWDNPDFWALFDRAREDPEETLAIALSTRHNHNVTEKQIKNMLAIIPESEHSRFLDGTRPEGRAVFFAKTKVYQCEDEEEGKEIEYYASEGAEFYKIVRANPAGVVELTTPPVPGANYIIIGDPGTKNPPRRDSPVIMVWEIPHDFPQSPMRLAAFWWGFGNNQITPFVKKLLWWSGIEAPPEEIDEESPVYPPVFIGMDSTGTQRNFAEILNLQIMEPEGTEDDNFGFYGRKIVGMDFSGAKKPTYLLSLRLFIENLLIRWPKTLNGLRQQLLNYDPKLDRGNFPKKAQDIVATMAMSAFAARVLFNVQDTELMPKNIPPPSKMESKALRDRRLSGHARNRRRRRKIPTEYEPLQAS
jgi:hypothetical protein